MLQYKERSKGFWRMRQKTIDPLFKTELKEDEKGVIDDAEVCYSSSSLSSVWPFQKGIIDTVPAHTPVKELKPRRLSDPVTGGEKRRVSQSVSLFIQLEIVIPEFTNSHCSLDENCCEGKEKHEEEGDLWSYPFNRWSFIFEVFVMITINLICWLPYFAHALISSLKLNDEFSLKFQFYSALVVFNAISNILL